MHVKEKDIGEYDDRGVYISKTVLEAERQRAEGRGMIYT